MNHLLADSLKTPDNRPTLKNIRRWITLAVNLHLYLLHNMTIANSLFKLAALTLSCNLLISQPIAFAAESAPSATAKLQAVEDFFAYPAFSDLRLSPDGKNIAVLVPAPNGRLKLATFDLQTMQPKVIAGYGDADIGKVNRVNNQRLVYSLTNRKMETVDEYMGPGLFAINKDGSDQRQLVNLYWRFVNEISLNKILPGNTYFHDVIHTGKSDDIFVMQIERENSFKYSTYNLLRLNTVTGRAVDVQRPGKTLDWLIDKEGVPRVAETIDEDVTSIYYKDPGQENWRKIFSYKGQSSDFNPWQIGPDGTLYVQSSKNKDTKLLYRFDLQKNELDKDHLISLNNYDFSGELVFGEKKLLGVQYETDAPGSLWFDPAIKQLQEEIDAAFPATINTLQLREGSENIIISSISDTDPGTYRLYNRNTKVFTPFGRINPKIDPTKMANKEFLHYKARDGLSIPAYLTLPKGVPAKNLPLVIMVHGGPFVRGVHWKWEATSQFLASRGYAVLEPEFRGSRGYGTKHSVAGRKQWGLAMQDDLVDGVKWAIAQGYADPNRVCIAGASYGGYATMMGLIRDPELFRCGISWVGVSDINLMYNVSWSDMMDESAKYWMPIYVGDQTKDAAQLKATSPLEQAARLKLPLILAYGREDRRVPIVHGTKFYNAVKGHNPDVEWIEYRDEGHGWRFLENHVDFWNRVEKFLAKHNGPKIGPAQRVAGATKP